LRYSWLRAVAFLDPFGTALIVHSCGPVFEGVPGRALTKVSLHYGVSGADWWHAARDVAPLLVEERHRKTVANVDRFLGTSGQRVEVKQ
jgi:hypothetical protein